MANTSVSLIDLDFETLKNNLKTYLKRSDSPFKDIDFEGSNISQLLDILAYNTYINGFYLNMVGNEMFLDTALLRDSVVSHAKELNYLPRSFRSAQANVSFTVTPSSAMTSLLIPKGTSFTTKVGSNNYSFVTNESSTVDINANNKFNVALTIYEGSFVTDSFTYSTSNSSQRFILSNPTIDTRSLTLSVVENNGANVFVYTRASTLLGLTSNSQIYFLQPAENSQYEIVFGDGIIGRIPKNGAIISAEYRTCNGELPNGARSFDVDGAISGQSNISSITTTSIATGGAVAETMESIKRNAPRHYQNQERAVTTSDYETLLLTNFPELEAVSAFGGEDVIPPQYGKVFIAVDNKNLEGAPESAKVKYYDFIKPRSPISIDPVFVDPEFIFIEIKSLVRYNTNVTTLQLTDIETLVKTTISSYATNNLNGFNKTLRGSKLAEAINNAHSSIISTDVNQAPYKKLSVIPGTSFSVDIDFGFKLTTTLVISHDDFVTADVKAVYSEPFLFGGRLCNIQDNREGVLGVYTAEGEDKNLLLSTCGTVNYETGEVSIAQLIVDSFDGPHIHLYVNPLEKDISSTKNYILTISDEDIIVDAVALKI